MGKFEFHHFNFQPIAKLDPNRPSRKFTQPKSVDDSFDDELKDKKAKRAERLQALAEETFDSNFWVNRKTDLAANLANDEYVELIRLSNCFYWIRNLLLYFKLGQVMKLLRPENKNKKRRKMKRNVSKKKHVKRLNVLAKNLVIFIV